MSRVSTTVNRDLEPRLQWFRATLFVLIVISTYLNVPLASGGRLLVPSFPTVALMPILFLAVWRNFDFTDTMFLTKMTLLLLATIAFSPGYAYIMEKFLSLVQFMLALVVTVMTVRLMLQLRRNVLEFALLTLWVLVIVGSVLEIAGVIRDVSDAFRVWAYSGTYTLYLGDIRDINWVGWLRPRLFSTEPSHVSTLFIVAVNAWLVVRVTTMKLAITAVATGVMFMLMGSPMFLVSAAMTLAILLWNQRATVRARVSMLVSAFLVGVVFLSFFGESALSTVAMRLERIGESSASQGLRSSSENQRVLYPWLTLADTWSRWPLFGVGVGGKEIVMENNIFAGAADKTATGVNASAQFGIFLGLLGGATFVWLLAMYAFETGVQRLGLLLIVGGMVCQLQGGIEGFRLWGFIAPLWGALAYSDSRAPIRAKPQRASVDRDSGTEGFARSAATARLRTSNIVSG